MTTDVCTLVEGEYHYGLGALVNSLYAGGFRGVVWVGYRGELPPWVVGKCTDGPDYVEYSCAEGCSLRFVLVSSSEHFTLYKPQFLIDIFERLSPTVPSVAYLDPDIVVRCPWSFIENWISAGIAVCEDRRSPVYQTGPQKTIWRQTYEPHGFKFEHSGDHYVNGGFIGLRRAHLRLVKEWKVILDLMAPLIASGDPLHIAHPSSAFAHTDQDALNIALENTELPICMMNKQAMDFEPGGFVMCHALGPVKPWRKNLLAGALRGILPMVLTADRHYMAHATYPIRLYSPLQFKLRQFERRLSTAVARIRGA